MFRKVVYLSGLITLAALPARAHEKWLVDASQRGEVPALFRSLQPVNIAVVAAALVVVALLIVLGRRDKAERPRTIYQKLEPWAPTILGIAAGVSLTAAALDRTLFAPNLLLPDGALATAAVIAELLVGIFLIIGFFTRVAVFLFAALFVASFFWFGLDALDYLNLFGVAFFLLVWGRGRLALASIFGRIFMAMQSSHLRSAALFVLRLLTALTLLLLGFEKIIRPDLHLRLFELYPTFNPYLILHAFLPFLSKELYLFILAVAELAAGILLAAGAWIRVVSLLLLLPFLLSPVFLGASEIFGHLPIIGTLVALFILGRSKIFRK